jgi:MFS family permease
MTRHTRHYWPVLLMVAFSVMSYFDRTILSVAAPRIIQEFRLSATEMGLAFFAFQASYTLLMTQGGIWADRYGPRLVLTAMGLGSGLLTAIMPWGTIPGLGALFGVVPSLMLLRFLFGVFTAPLYPSTGRLNSDWVPENHRTRAQGLVNSGAGLGGAISPVLFTFLMAAVGWRTSFAAAGVVTMMLALLWYITTPGLPAPHPRLVTQGGPSKWQLLSTNRNLLLLTAGYFGIDYFEYIFFYWLYYYLSEIRHLPADQTALYTTCPFVAWVVMMPLGGWLCDWACKWYGSHAALRGIGVAGIAVSVILLVAALQSPDILTTVILLSLAFGFCAISDVVSWTAVISIAGKEAGAFCGIMNTGGNLGGMIAPVLTPWIASRYGWSAGLYFGGAVVSIALFTWLRFSATRKPHASPLP